MQFGPPIQCFWLEPTGRVRLELRRYRGLRQSETCTHPMGYHNAIVTIGEAPAQYDEQGYLTCLDETIPHDDPRWVNTCVCGVAFTEEDRWQVNQAQIYTRLDTGEETTLDDAPAGAMWDAWWCRSGGSEIAKPDGINLMVRCPSVKGWKTTADWYVDGRASNCPGWTRTGVAKSANPTVTAHPSIGIGVNMEEYHGWLRDGKLVSV